MIRSTITLTIEHDNLVEAMYFANSLLIPYDEKNKPKDFRIAIEEVHQRNLQVEDLYVTERVATIYPPINIAEEQPQVPRTQLHQDPIEDTLF